MKPGTRTNMPCTSNVQYRLRKTWGPLYLPSGRIEYQETGVTWVKANFETLPNNKRARVYDVEEAKLYSKRLKESVVSESQDARNMLMDTDNLEGMRTEKAASSNYGANASTSVAVPDLVKVAQMKEEATNMPALAPVQRKTRRKRYHAKRVVSRDGDWKYIVGCTINEAGDEIVCRV